MVTGMTNTMATANIGEEMSLTLTRQGGAGNYLAMDSLAYEQVVPEPSTFALAAFGLLGLLACGRRRRR